MSFDRTTRNALARMVGQVRELLKFDVMDQLLRLGFQADGSVLDLGQIFGLSELDRVAGKELRDLLEHFVALESGPEAARRQAAYDRLAREIGFTALNRLVALRMAEERGLIVQTVGRGLASDGFQIYERVARDALGNRAETYRSYLECLYDELALDLPMLFDRTTPESRIFPSERCLEEVLSVLNDASLAHLRKEDEAMGWAYQCYTDPDERRKMREVQAPRNSRELAVRNQFFTPRYVVEFLTDNTLGRIWYEMRQGNTQFSDQRRYLVRRPVDIFLQDGEEALQSAEPEEDLSLEELVNRPAFILFRAKKDPRDLTILDPACGSGHFLLYAFDLLETIYEEAWADNSSPISAITGTWLRNDYADLAALRRASPELILRHNLYGIDIDPRACQIAALALWLRAQRSYQQLGLTAAERPQITKSNIVCAEPMSGEREMLEEYLKEHVDPRLHPLVRTIWNKMQLAGEAGSLLKIEEEIKTVLVEAREQALVDTPLIQLSLSQRDQPMQVRLTIPASEERTFWEQAEEKLLAALRDYASKTPNGHLTQRRLFAEDVAQGFAFIDLCRNRFDVILMNPPFGKTSLGAASYIKQAYKDNWKDLYAVFIERCLRLLSQGGMLGAITSSQFLYTKQLRALRHTLIEQQLVRFRMELGLGVLACATVETALTVLSTFHTPICGFLDLTKIANKGEALYAAVHPDGQGLLWQHLTRFQKLFNWPLCYHITDDKLSLWDSDHRLEPDLATVVLGNHTFDDERFLRLRWEVAPNTIGTRWFAYEKGGEYQPFIAPPHLLFNWVDNGAEAREHTRANYGTDDQTMQSISWWYKPGLAYSRVSSVGFGPRILPAGSIFSEKGISIFPNSPSDRIPILGLLVSSWTEDLLNAFGRHRAYENSAVANLPFGQDTIAIRESEIASLTLLGIDFVWTHEEGLEPSAFFIMPLSIKSGESYRSHACEVQCQISQ